MTIYMEYDRILAVTDIPDGTIIIVAQSDPNYVVTSDYYEMTSGNVKFTKQVHQCE